LKRNIFSITFISVVLFIVLGACAGSAASEALKGTEQEINSAFSNQITPVISGDYIVWQDERDGNWDIYLYDMSVGRTESACSQGQKMK
jgi:beta propeller repeat protein